MYELIGRKPAAMDVVKRKSPEDLGPRHLWPVLEELAVWVYLVECASPEDYFGSCEWYCQSTGRAAVHHSQKYEARAAVDLIEMRTVTRHMDQQYWSQDRLKLLFKTADELVGTYRTGRPLTWMEKYRALPSYANKPDDNRAAVSDDRLLALLGRGPGDQELVNLHLKKLARVKVRERKALMLTPSRPAGLVCVRDRNAIGRLLGRVCAYGNPRVWAAFRTATQGDVTCPTG